MFILVACASKEDGLSNHSFQLAYNPVLAAVQGDLDDPNQYESSLNVQFSNGTFEANAFEYNEVSYELTIHFENDDETLYIVFNLDEGKKYFCKYTATIAEVIHMKEMNLMQVISNK